jgi:hypothetical protein
MSLRNSKPKVLTHEHPLDTSWKQILEGYFPSYRHVAAEDLGKVGTSAEPVKISFAQRPQRGIADPARNQVARPRR